MPRISNAIAPKSIRYTFTIFYKIYPVATYIQKAIIAIVKKKNICACLILLDWYMKIQNNIPMNPIVNAINKCAW